MNIVFNCDREKSHPYDVSAASILSVNVEILGLKPGFVDIEFLCFFLLQQSREQSTQSSQADISIRQST